MKECDKGISRIRSKLHIIYICYAQRGKTLNERKKHPERVVAISKEPRHEISVFTVRFVRSHQALTSVQCVTSFFILFVEATEKTVRVSDRTSRATSV
jgi:hypothetical protein